MKAKEEEFMKGKKFIILSIFLLIIILVLIGYILVDKNIIEIPGTTATNNNTEEKEETPEIVEIDVNNANVRALFDQVHSPDVGFDTFIFQNGGGTVEDMTEEYKFSIATNTNAVQITTVNPEEYNEEVYGYVMEEDVKDAYERLFGPNTYHSIESFTLGCMPMSYDSANGRYVATTYGCGGKTMIDLYEEIISIQKEEGTLSVTTAVGFLDTNTGKLYKDMDLTVETPFTANTNYTEEEIRNYINSYKDNLTQYTYTFEYGNDGFYYYTGVERTK